MGVEVRVLSGTGRARHLVGPELGRLPSLRHPESSAPGEVAREAVIDARFVAFGFALLVVCAAACGARNPLPTHRDLNAYPTAILDATLVMDGSCLWASNPSGRWLAIWPSGYTLDGVAVASGGQLVAAVGGPVRLGGGEYHAADYDFLRTLMNDDLPMPCRGGDYWLVSGAVP